MYPGMLGLAVGLVSVRFLPSLPSGWLITGLVLLGIGCLRFQKASILAGLMLGLAWGCAYGHWALADRLGNELEGRTFWIEGQVVGLPEQQEGVVRFELDQVHSRHSGLPSKVRLSWYRGPTIQAGERWRVAARLSRPRGLVNPQGFDYEAWLLTRGVGAVGTVKAGQRVAEAPAGRHWRDALRQALWAVEAHGRSAVLAALVMGDGSGLSSRDWQILQDTGTVHLLVISGQHISLLAGLLFAGVATLARWGLWPKTWPWLPCASALALLGALGYGALAGFEVPVQRACVAVALVVLWRLRFQHLGVVFPLLVSLDAVLVLNPLASLQPGFWLSFGAVALLLFGFAGRLGAWPWWVSLWRAQWVMAIGLLPLLLALGLPISLSSPLANFVAIPWISILVLPLALLGTLLLPIPSLSALVLGLAGGLVDELFQFLNVLATHQPAWLAPNVDLFSWLLILCGSLVMLLPVAFPIRILGLLLWFPLAFPTLDRPTLGQAKVWVLDVGQGLSVLVLTSEHNLLYDTGPRQGDFDLGARVVLPSVRALGVDSLDRLILSHEDADHAGGTEAIRQNMPIRSLISGTHGRLAQRFGAEDCQSGSSWDWDQVHFSLWHWPAADNDNRASCVLMIEASGERLLLTGDIDHAAEQALVASGTPVQADWLVLPHHGSRSSSSMPFLTAVAPHSALISRGYRNAFGHPHPAVLDRLHSLNIIGHDTALSGALQIELGRFEAPKYARNRPRFWRTQ